MTEEIDPGDAMFAGNREHYLSVGRSALQCIKVSMLAASRETFANILDLPSGHGRVLRHLKSAFPKARLTACDINTQGVDFCVTAFGATGVYGHESPRNIPLEGNYDLIWVGSLLTHLNSNACADFLDFFRDLLCPKGLLVFTVHGRTVADRLRCEPLTYGMDSDGSEDILNAYKNKGFGYANYPQKASPELGANYGISVASPCWSFRQVERMPDMRLLNYTEDAWDNKQDVVTLLRL